MDTQFLLTLAALVMSIASLILHKYKPTSAVTEVVDEVKDLIPPPTPGSAK